MKVSPKYTSQQCPKCGRIRKENRHHDIHYGSLMVVFSNYNQGAMMQKLKEIIYHEFQHHMEYRAGCRDLEIEDEKFVEKADERLRKYGEA